MAHWRSPLVIGIAGLASLSGCAEERWAFEAHTANTPVDFTSGTSATLAVTVSCPASTLPPDGYYVEVAVTLSGLAPSFGREYFASPGQRTDEEPFYVTRGRDFRVPFSYDSRTGDDSPFTCDAAGTCTARLSMDVVEENEAFAITARVDATFIGYASLSPPDNAGFSVAIDAP
jgi:hypothetical protein